MNRPVPGDSFLWIMPKPADVVITLAREGRTVAAIARATGMGLADVEALIRRAAQHGHIDDEEMQRYVPEIAA